MKSTPILLSGVALLSLVIVFFLTTSSSSPAIIDESIVPSTPSAVFAEYSTSEQHKSSANVSPSSSSAAPAAVAPGSTSKIDFSTVVDAAIRFGKMCYHSRFSPHFATQDDVHDTTLVSHPVKNSATGSTVSVFQRRSTGCLTVSLQRGSKAKKERDEKWTRDDEALRLGSALGVDGRSGWSEGKLILYDSQNTVVGYKPFFLFAKTLSSSAACVCLPSQATLQDKTVDRIEVRVIELFKNADAISELKEDLPVRYFTSIAEEQTVVQIQDPTAVLKQRPVVVAAAAAVASSSMAEWTVIGTDTTNYEKDARYGGYWLRFKGDTTRGNKLSATHDLLGRMDLRAKFAFTGGAAEAKGGRLEECPTHSGVEVLDADQRRVRMMDALGQKGGSSILFVGDSHVRTLYYGLLERLGISFAANRVWRGGHEAKIEAKNVHLRFVPSSFLDLEVLRKALEAAEEQSINKKKDTNHHTGEFIVVAGVAQHHSTHCYTLRRHAEHVKQALDVLTPAGRSPRRVIWFGVPAQPVNRHLFASKPVGQARRDCRSNARHLLYSTIQLALVNEKQKTLQNRHHLHYLDAFALSAGLTATSIDGAHFYSFVREAMLDHLNAFL